MNYCVKKLVTKNVKGETDHFVCHLRTNRERLYICPPMWKQPLPEMQCRRHVTSKENRIWTSATKQQVQFLSQEKEKIWLLDTDSRNPDINKQVINRSRRCYTSMCLGECLLRTTKQLLLDRALAVVKVTQPPQIGECMYRHLGRLPCVDLCPCWLAVWINEIISLRNTQTLYSKLSAYPRTKLEVTNPWGLFTGNSKMEKTKCLQHVPIMWFLKHYTFLTGER